MFKQKKHCLDALSHCPDGTQWGQELRSHIEPQDVLAFVKHPSGGP